MSGAKLGLSRHVTEGGAVQEPYTVMADTGGGRGACEEKAEGLTKPIRQLSQRVRRENKRKRSRLQKDKAIHLGAGGRERGWSEEGLRKEKESERQSTRPVEAA